jgi:hypothetical protein
LGGAPAVFAIRYQPIRIGNDWPAKPTVLAHPVLKQTKLLVAHFVRVVAIRR